MDNFSGPIVFKKSVDTPTLQRVDKYFNMISSVETPYFCIKKTQKKSNYLQRDRMNLKIHRIPVNSRTSILT